MKIINKIFKSLVIVFVALLVVLGAVWGGFPTISSSAINKFLTPYELTLEDASEVNFNPFLSKLTIKDLRLLDKESTVLNIDSLTLSISYSELIQGEFDIELLELEGVFVKIVYSDEQVSIAGISQSTEVAPIETVPAEENPESSPFLLRAPVVKISDVLIEVDLYGKSEKRTLQLKTGGLDLEGLMFSTESGVDVGQLLISGFNVLDVLESDSQFVSLASWEKFSLNGFRYGFIDEKLSIDNIAWHKISVSKFENKLPLVSLEDLQTSSVIFGNNTFSVSDVKANGLMGIIERNETGSLNHLANYDFSILDSSEDTPQKPEPEVGESNPVNVEIQSFLLTDTNNLSVKDNSVSPAYAQEIQINKVNVGRISSAELDLATPVEAEILVDQFSKVNLTGELKPFSEKINAKIDGAISEYSLPSISAYLGDMLGIEVKTGQMDIDVNLGVVEDEIKGVVDVLLRGTDLSSSDNYQESSLKDQTVIPLNVALGMLKDGKGNIALNIPLDGRVDDPSFGVTSFFRLLAKKAILKASKSYLMKTFVPYSNVISVVKGVGEFALKLRFEDLSYVPGETQIADGQLEYVDQFVQLMKDKPKTAVKVCAVASHLDLNVTPDGLKADKSLQKKAAKISEQRQNEFKQRVISSEEIDSSRILLCSPGIDYSENATPRIEISI